MVYLDFGIQPDYQTGTMFVHYVHLKRNLSEVLSISTISLQGLPTLKVSEDYLRNISWGNKINNVVLGTARNMDFIIHSH